MAEKHSLETQVALLIEHRESTKEAIQELKASLDKHQSSQSQKLDAIQISMSNLHSVFVTQKDFLDHEKRIEASEKRLDKQDIRSAFILGVGFFAVLVKDYIVDGIVKLISYK